MLELIGVDGLTQWDVGRQVKVDKDINMVHFSNRPYGYSKNVKVTNGVADVPDMFLTSCAPLRVWAYVGDFEKGYTKIEKIYEVKPKNRPEDYIYTPEEIKTWEKLQSEIGDLANLETKAKENLVVAINEAAKSGGESYTLPQATANALGGVKADSAEAVDTQPVRIGGDGKLYTAPGGKTPNITIGNVETLEAGQNATAIITGESPDLTLNLGIPKGADGQPGTDGKTAYQYAVEGGYTKTEAEFAEKLAQEQLTGTTGNLTPTQVYDAVSAGIPVKVQYFDNTYGLLSFTAFNVAESLNVIVSQTIVYYNDVYILAELNGDKSDNTWGTAFTTLAQKADIPEALPNPNALTFTGAVNATYDGSTAVSVEIPSGGSGGTDISLGLTSASVGQIIKVKAIDASGKPTAWEAANMQSGGGHWETVLDTVWEQDVINPTAFDSETGIFTCAEGELNNLALNTEYVFFQQCVKEGAAYNTILGNENLKVTKLSDTTFSIDATPPTTFVPTNVKFSRGACLAVTDIDAKKIRLTLDGQFKPTATLYDKPFLGTEVSYFGMNTGHQQIRNAYQAYQQVTAEVESPYRIVGQILCGFNAPSQNASFHFKNNSFCCPLVPYVMPEGALRPYFLNSDGTKIAKLYSTSAPHLIGTAYDITAIGSDYIRIISGTKVKLERWVE